MMIRSISLFRTAGGLPGDIRDILPYLTTSSRIATYVLTSGESPLLVRGTSLDLRPPPIGVTVVLMVEVSMSIVTDNGLSPFVCNGAL